MSLSSAPCGKRSYKQEELLQRIQCLDQQVSALLASGAVNSDLLRQVHQEKQELEKRLRKIRSAQMRQRKHRQCRKQQQGLERSVSGSSSMSMGSSSASSMPSSTSASPNCAPRVLEVVHQSQHHVPTSSAASPQLQADLELVCITSSSELEFLRHFQSIVSNGRTMEELEQLVVQRLQFLAEASHFGVEKARIFYKLKRVFQTPPVLR
eukprot:TRINITY_DN4068_c0_g2_i1.p1 TRINITY_DN4068_c0_g2~~TRINITY_DN4068_c0_g2_i1.p1  ORF type:complete len:209 (+),score=36.69 TRINITY_DN4068_c0_g2_i1:144-770(+)